jgi:hypothetical protein
LYSGAHGRALAHAKARALHQFRDEEWNARLDLARIRAREGGWHSFWRSYRRSKAPDLTEDTYDKVAPFLASPRHRRCRVVVTASETAVDRVLHRLADGDELHRTVDEVLARSWARATGELRC